VDIPQRWVDIFALQILDWQPGPPADLTIAIACGPGTYIRSLARDLGALLGVGGTLASLRRTQSCGFNLADSVTLADLNPETTGLIPPPQALIHLPALTLDPELARRWCCGQKLSLETIDSDTPYRVLDDQGTVLGIGQLNDLGLFCPQVVLSPVA
jgi:tRNA pseudouridine55 synthase